MKALTDECLTSTNYSINPSEYIYTIDEPNPAVNLYRSDTLCGPWELNVEYGDLSGKASLDPDWWQFELVGVTIEDVNEYLVIAHYTFGDVIESYSFKVTI